MNYELEVSKSIPAVFNSLNGSLPPLVAGSGSATLLSSALDTTFLAFSKAYPNEPFSLEVWFRPLTNTGEQVVIGHASEGVLWNGTQFILRTKHGDAAASTEVGWTPPMIKAFHLVMVYTPGQASLYVDGVLTLNINLPMTPFASTGTIVRLNGGTGTGIYDSMALYYRALPGSEILEHYIWGKAVRSPVQVATANGGSTWNLMHGESDIYATERFDAANWDLFFLNGLGVIGGRLTPNEGGGTWMGMVPLSAIIEGVTAGISLKYQGLGVVLSYSTDGAAWTPVVNGAIILEDTDVTDVNLLVRIDLPDEGWVDYLTVSILNDRILSPASGTRDLAYRKVELDYENPSPLDYLNTWGAVIIPGGYMTVPIDAAEPVRAVEMWVKPNTTGATATFVGAADWVGISATGLLSNTNGVTVYRNGQALANGGQVGLNTWNHLLIIFPSDRTTNLRIGQSVGDDAPLDGAIGHLALYNKSFSAAEALALYQSNVGSPRLRIDDASGVTLTEQATPVAFYAQDWSYISGGS